MSSKIPPCLQQLIDARDDAARDRAWAALLCDYSKLILHVARSTSSDHDATMDRYEFVLDALRREDFRRLRAYSEDGRGSFTTWLVAVTRRLCIDEHRRRYGRPQGECRTREMQERVQLVDLLNSLEALDSLESPGHGPHGELEVIELGTALESALRTLDMPDRLLIRLRFEDELPVPEIATILGEPSPFRIYRRLEKILGELRKSLERAGIDGSTQ